MAWTSNGPLPGPVCLITSRQPLGIQGEHSIEIGPLTVPSAARYTAESLRTNEDYDFLLRAAIAGCRFWRNDEPLGWYRRRDDSLSAGELRMIRGIIRVFQKTRPALLGYPAELAVLDAQLTRFETARIAA